MESFVIAIDMAIQGLFQKFLNFAYRVAGLGKKILMKFFSTVIFALGFLLFPYLCTVAKDPIAAFNIAVWTLILFVFDRSVRNKQEPEYEEVATYITITGIWARMILVLTNLMMWAFSTIRMISDVQISGPNLGLMLSVLLSLDLINIYLSSTKTPPKKKSWVREKADQLKTARVQKEPVLAPA